MLMNAVAHRQSCADDQEHTCTHMSVSINSTTAMRSPFGGHLFRDKKILDESDRSSGLEW
jgi:hypothetical protein